MAGDGAGTGWRERAASFGAVASEYALLRPGYPPEVVPFLVEGPGPSDRAVDPPPRVLDLAAGTGLLTRELVRAGLEVVAVDPAEAMLDQLTVALPGTTALLGSAEAIPVPDSSVDVVTAAQAAHWFDPVRAAPEMLRVLRPSGTVGLVWNVRDDTVPWVAALEEILAGESYEKLGAAHDMVDAFAVALDAAVDSVRFTLVQRTTPTGVIRGLATRSYVVTMTEEHRARFLGSIADLLATHPDTRGRGELEMQYVTSAWRLRPGGLHR